MSVHVALLHPGRFPPVPVNKQVTPCDKTIISCYKTVTPYDKAVTPYDKTAIPCYTTVTPYDKTVTSCDKTTTPPRVTVFPAHWDLALEACPYMWPFCTQVASRPILIYEMKNEKNPDFMLNLNPKILFVHE